MMMMMMIVWTGLKRIQGLEFAIKIIGLQRDSVLSHIGSTVILSGVIKYTSGFINYSNTTKNNIVYLRPRPCNQLEVAYPPNTFPCPRHFA